MAYTRIGNVWCSPELYLEAVEYAGKELAIGASVFGPRELEFLLHTSPDFIKFSYGKKDQVAWIIEALDSRKEVMVSCDVMTEHLVPEGAKKLFCVSQYPVYQELSFDELFPRFDGFSDHTLGIRQTTKSVVMGAKIIEKHVKLNHHDVTCPDALFAVDFQEMSFLVNHCRRIEKENDL